MAENEEDSDFYPIEGVQNGTTTNVLYEFAGELMQLRAEKDKCATVKTQCVQLARIFGVSCTG